VIRKNGRSFPELVCLMCIVIYVYRGGGYTDMYSTKRLCVLYIWVHIECIYKRQDGDDDDDDDVELNCSVSAQVTVETYG